MAKRSISLRALTGGRVRADAQGRREHAFAGVWKLVRRIPKGRVMTYGQIANSIESRLSPRAVGWAMSGCPKGVPWQRVVNASGGCSTDQLADGAPGLQRAFLEREGVEFRANGTLDLERYRWVPRPRKTARRKTTRQTTRR